MKHQKVFAIGLILIISVGLLGCVEKPKDSVVQSEAYVDDSGTHCPNYGEVQAKGWNMTPDEYYGFLERCNGLK